MSQLTSPANTSRLALGIALIALIVTIARPAREPEPPRLSVASTGVAAGTTPDTGLVPGSGFVEVGVPDRSRTARFTPYQYGTTIQTGGKESGRFEFFLGDNPLDAPELSVRGNGSNRGALVQAREGRDRYGVGMSARESKRPYLGVIDDSNQQPGAELVIGNPEADGSIVISSGRPLTPRLRITGDGAIELLGSQVRLHGSKGSGRASADPGAVTATSSAAELTQTVNALRKTLVDHGLLQARP